MGILVRYLSQIPDIYEIYVIFVANEYGNTAERVICKKFEQIAYDIGSQNIIARVLDWPGRAQTEQKFNIAVEDLRPVLVVIDVHPEKWTPRNSLIKLQLGKMRNEDEVKDFLFKFSKHIAAGDFGKIKWHDRLQRLRELKKFFPIEINLISIDVFR